MATQDDGRVQVDSLAGGSVAADVGTFTDASLVPTRSGIGRKVGIVLVTVLVTLASAGLYVLSLDGPAEPSGGPGSRDIAASSGVTPALLPPHVQRSDTGYSPEAGYDWISPETGDLRVRWVLGKRHPTHANIRSGASEGTWQADPGYTFVAEGELRVQWRAGLTHPTVANVVSTNVVGQWQPAPGYGWVNPGKSDEVRWMAGLPHPTEPHVVSRTVEGKWEPEAGYRWANLTPGDFSVVKAGPSEQQGKDALAKIMIALLADTAASGGGNSLGDQVIREGLKGLRNEAVRGAFADLFPYESRRARDAAANIVILAADGQLTAHDWTARNVRDELVQRLKAEDSSIADAYQMAEFIGNVLNAYEQGR